MVKSDLFLKDQKQDKGAYLPILFKIILVVLCRGIRQGKEIKAIKIGKEDEKLFLFADGMVLFVEKPKNSTKKF